MRKNRRTFILGVLATGALVGSAIYHFGVPAEEMAWLFAWSVLGVVFIAALAATTVAAVHGLRYLLRRWRDEQDR